MKEPQAEEEERPRTLRALGLGLITGAADDDPSAIGTYASAGAKFGPAFLWAAPFIFPMMFAVVYLSSKLGQVSGRGLFAAMRDQYPRWVVDVTLVGVLIGNTIEAAADIGGIAAAVELLVPIPRPVLVVLVAGLIFSLQLWGSYRLIRNVFRWLALTLLAYIGAAVLARPDLRDVLRHTFVPHIQLNREYLSLLVAIFGTTLSAYLYTWQSNEEVEEEIAQGRIRLSERIGATEAELAASRRDILFGVLFSNIVLYFIILSTGATLYRAGVHDIETAADAAKALRPLAGNAAGLLFALGVVGVGFISVPVMTTGAAYDLCQSLGWEAGLAQKPREGARFYGAIAFFTAVAVGMNFLGINPMRALVWAGIVQGFSTPPLMMLIMRMTNNRQLMGDRVNGWAINVLGWTTVVVSFTATAGLVVTWFL
ncbi:MAG: divalent metal cation transporter [Myxococcaceae bacterium]|nr:divalent metal cation transporter [Myxococcaceae bacterium]